MIFFGSRGKTVSGHMIEGIQCPHCENRQFFTFGVIRYFHLYWVPTFITSKKVGIECTHCKKTLLGKELPNDLSKEIKAVVFNTKNTTPMFSGLIIIALIAMFFTYSVQKQHMEETSYIEQPIKNDLYIVNLTKIFTGTDPEYKYGIMRVSKIYSDQAEFQLSTIAYHKAKGASKDIKEGKAYTDSYYDSEPVYIDLNKLKNMKESGVIHSIKRT